jgi:hypothetical protein
MDRVLRTSSLVLKPHLNLAVSVSRLTTSSIIIHPVTGEKPPTLEEFDPVNPGNWQVGVCSLLTNNSLDSWNIFFCQ